MTRSADLDRVPHLLDDNAFTRHDDLVAHGDTRVVVDAALLFSGHYRQVGDDLLIVRPFQSVTVHGYFNQLERPVLTAPDGSSLSPSVVEAMTEGRPGPQVAAQQPPRGDAIGRVESVSGGATVVRSGQILALHKDDLVFKGDAVQTDDHGALAIVFIDGTAFNLSASARMVLNDMVYQPGGESNSSLLSVVQGSISFVAGNIAHTGGMKVDTPVATMGIRGTAVHVVQPDHGPTRFSVMREPSGRVGQYVLYSKQHPDQVIGTVADADQVVEVRLDDGQVIVIAVPKTLLELQDEQSLVDDVFQTFEAGQHDPVLRWLHAPSQSGGSPGFVPPSSEVGPPVSAPSPPVFEGPGMGPPQNGAPTPLPPFAFAPNNILPFLIAAKAQAAVVQAGQNGGGGSVASYGAPSVVTIGGSAGETPSATSPGDRFAFAPGTSGIGTYGDATVNASTGVVSYTATSAPVAGKLATDSFTIVDTDAAGARTRATATFTVDGGSAVFYAPASAVAKGHTTSETPSVISPEGGDHFTFASGAAGAYGTATLDATTGAVTYTATGAPAAGTTATDSFTIVDTDADHAQTTATATFTVDGGSAVSYAPASAVAKGYGTSEMPTVTSPEGGDHFTFASGASGAAGAYGTATLDATTGAVTYTATGAPAAGTTATDSFTIVDTDADGARTRATATFTVDGGSAVSYAPASAVAKGYGTSETPSVTSPEGGDHFAFASGASGAAGAYGTATINATTGGVTYTATSAPAAGTTATDSFTIVDTDADHAQTTATATFTVDGGSAVSYAPVPAVAKGYSTSETPAVTSPEGGDHFTFASGASGAAGAYGTATINATTGVVTYTATSTPAAGMTATDSFTIVDTDKDHAQTTATATFTIDGPDKWIGSSGSWTDGANWSEGHAPDAEPALVPSGTAPDILNDGAAVVADDVALSNAGTVTIAPGATFVLEDGTTITGGMLAIGASGGVLDIEQGGGAPVQQGATPYGATLDGVAVTNDGAIDIGASATLTLDDGTAIGSGTVTFTASGGVLDIELGSGASGASGATLDNVTVGLGGSGDSGVVEVDHSATLTLEDAATIDGVTLTIASGATVAIAVGEGTSNVTFDGVTVDNAGTIAVAASQTFTLVDGTSIGGGAISIGGSGATLDVEGSGQTGGADATLVGVTVTNDGTIEVADTTTAFLLLESGTTITGGTVSVGSSGASGEIDVELGSGGGATLDGVILDNNNGSIVVDQGAAGAALTIGDGTTISGGTLTIASATGVLAVAASGATLEDVSVSNDGTIQVGTNQSAATLTIEDNTTISGGTLVIAEKSTLDVESSLTVDPTLDDVAVTNSGSITVALQGSPTVLTLEDGTTVAGGALTIGTYGTLAIEGSNAVLDGVAAGNSGSIQVDATLTLEGGTTITGGSLTIMAGQGGNGILDVESATGATLDGVVVTNGGGIEIAEIAAATLTLEGGTAITGGDLTIGTNGGLAVAAGGSGASAALDDVAVTNGGTITIASSATLTLEAGTSIAGGTITSSGTILVTGTSIIEGGSGGTSTSLSGGTVMLATGGATLSLFDTSVSAQTTVAFTQSNLLALDLKQPFSASISGFGTGDTLDLTSIAPGGETVSWTQGANGSGTLTVAGSSGSAHFTLDGTYSTSDFLLAPDSANAAAGIAGGGTDVLYVDRWNAPTDGDWTTSADWTHGTPAAATAAVIDDAGTYTVSITSADLASALYLNDSGATVLDGTNGSLALGGALNIEAGTFELAGGTLSTSTVVIGSGGTLDVEAPSNATAASSATFSGVIVTNGGTIEVDGNTDSSTPAFLVLEAGTTINGGIVAIGQSGGTIDVEGPTGAALSDVALTGNGGTVEVGMTSTATLTLEGGTTITGAFVTIEAPGTSSGGTLDIGGASGSDGAMLDGDVVSNGGTIEIASTATFDGDTVGNNGTIAIGSSASLTLDDDTTITGGKLTVGAGSGILDIERGGGTGVSGAELDGVAVTNSGTIAIAAAATLTLNGSTLDSSNGTLGNSGTIQIQGSSKLTLAASSKGTGTISIARGAALEVTAAENQTIIFAAATGTLRIDQPAAFTADISAAKGSTLATGDVFDFSSLDYATTTATTGTGAYDSTTQTTTLTVTDASTSQTYRFTLLGNYSASQFTVTNDGNGGADIADPPVVSASAAATRPSRHGSSASDAVIPAAGSLATVASGGASAAHVTDIAHTAPSSGDASSSARHASLAANQASASHASESGDTVSTASRTADHPLASTSLDGGTTGAAARAIEIADDDAPFAFSPHHRPSASSGHGSNGLSHALATTHQTEDEIFGTGDTFVFKPVSHHRGITGTDADGSSGPHDPVGLAGFHFAASRHVLNEIAEAGPSHELAPLTGHLALDDKAAHHAELFALGHHGAS